MNPNTNILKNYAVNVAESPAAQIKKLGDTLTFLASDRTAESSFLATMLAAPQYVDHAIQQRGVTSDVFTTPENRKVWDAMVKLAAQAANSSDVPDFSPVAFARVLDAAGCDLVRDLREIGGCGLLNADLNVAAKTALAALFDFARRRAAIARTIDVQISMLDRERDTGNAIQSACDAFSTLAASGAAAGQQMTRSIGDIVLPDRDPGGIRFPHLPFVSHALDGFRPGTLSVVAARTGVGKSSLLQSMALEAAIGQDVPTLYLDTEMTPEQFICRVIAARTGHGVAQIRNRAEHPSVAADVEACLADLRSRPLAYCSIAGQPIDFAINQIRRFQRYHPGRRILVAYDYIKLPVASANDRETQVLGAVTNALKEEAVKGGFAIVAGAQVNRAGLKMTHDDFVREGEGVIFGSDKIAHLCDALLLLRNLTEDEITRVLARFGPQHEDADPANRAAFNMCLYGAKVREGMPFAAGVPLYNRRGRYTFDEVAVERDANGSPIIENGRPRTSEVFGWFRSPDFRRQARRPAGFGALRPSNVEAA